MPRLIRNALRTPDGTVIVSNHRHDCVMHTDENGKTYMVDGGLEYARRSAHGDEIDMCLYDTEPHCVQVEVLKWGTYGKDGDQPLQYKPIAIMDTSHIQTVLNTQPQMSKLYRGIMEQELEQRNA